MADQFSYTVDNSIIIQDGNMIWSDTSQDQSSLHFMDANDTIITDATINESYVTAIDSNETQYLSILDSSEDVTLENMNLSNLSLGKNYISCCLIEIYNYFISRGYQSTGEYTPP